MVMKLFLPDRCSMSIRMKQIIVPNMVLSIRLFSQTLRVNALKDEKRTPIVCRLNQEMSISLLRSSSSFGDVY